MHRMNRVNRVNCSLKRSFSLPGPAQSLPCLRWRRPVARDKKNIYNWIVICESNFTLPFESWIHLSIHHPCKTRALSSSYFKSKISVGCRMFQGLLCQLRRSVTLLTVNFCLIWPLPYTTHLRDGPRILINFNLRTTKKQPSGLTGTRESHAWVMPNPVPKWHRRIQEVT